MKEKEEEKKNNSTEKFLIGVIIVLVFIIGILVGTRINGKEPAPLPKESVEEKEPIKEDNKPTEEKKENKKYDKDKLTKEARGLIAYELCGDPAMPLKKKDIKVEELSDDIKGKMVISTIINTKGYSTDNTVYIEPDDYAKYFDDLTFLEKLKNNKSAQYTLGAMILSYKNGKYAAETYATGCEGAYEGEELVFVSSNITGDTLILTYASFWSSYNYENDYYTYYKDENSKVVYDKIKYDNEKESYLYNGKEITYDEFDEYEFHFDLSNDNLKFEKITYNKN